MSKFPTLSRRTLLGGLGLGAGLAALGAFHYWPRTENGQQEPALEPGVDQVNCVFDLPPIDPFQAPDLKMISIPPFGEVLPRSGERRVVMPAAISGLACRQAAWRFLPPIYLNTFRNRTK